MIRQQPWSVLVVAGSLTFGAGAALLAAGAGSAASAGGARPRLSVSGAYVPPPGASSEVMAFATVRNSGGVPDTLIGVRTDVSTIVMMHRGVGSAMDMVDGVALPAHRTLTLTTGGLHIMIMEPTRRLRAGDLVRMTFVFARAEPVTVMAPVAAANDGPPAGQGGHRHG